MKLKRNSLIKNIFIGLATIASIVCLTTPVSAATKYQYVWLTTFDYNSNQVTSHILQKQDNELNKIMPVFKSSDDFEVVGTDAEITATSNIGSQSLSCYPLAWTGNRSASADDADRSYATFVANQLTSSFNTALAQIIRDLDLDMSNKDVLPNLSSAIADCAFEGTCKYNDKEFSIVKATDNDLVEGKVKSQLGEGNYMGVTSEDYRVLVTKDGVRLLLLVSFPKGYKDGQKLNGNHSGMDVSLDVSKVTWKHLVLSARTNNKNGITTANSNELESISDLEKSVNGLAKGLADGLTNLLGLVALEDLMLNKGTHNTAYYKGIANYTWFSVANVFHWICQVISVFAIVIGIALSFVKRNKSIISPTDRVSLKESFMNLFYVIVLLLSFNILFYGLVELNYLIVDLLSNMAPANASLAGSYGNGFLAGIIIAFAVLWFNLQININYLIRSITIIILYATAPLFIVSLMYGRTGKGMFSAWLKELVGNIFMQSVHALLLVIYLRVVNNGVTSGIERIILVYSFLPLTKAFKEKFLGSSVTDKATQETNQAVKKTVNDVSDKAKKVGKIAGDGVIIGVSAVGTKMMNDGNASGEKIVNAAKAAETVRSVVTGGGYKHRK